MDKMKKKHIDDFLNNTALFYSLLKNKSDSDESIDSIIQLLKTQHSMNKSSLINLGVSCDETNQIRALNNHVRQLELESAQKSNLDFKQVNQFMVYQQDLLKQFLTTKGISGSVEISMSSSLKVIIKVYSSNLKFSASYARNEQEAAISIQKQKDKSVRFRENFEFATVLNNLIPVEDNLLFSDKNIQQLESLFNQYFNAPIEQVSYQIRNRDNNFCISTYEFFLTTLDSSNIFKNVMSRF